MKPNTITILLVTATIMAFPQILRAGEWVSGSASTSSGIRTYKLWVPSGLVRQKPVPLLMMLHGCMQKPEDLATISGMNEIADRNGFLVVYPEQTVEANQLRCWNWFDPKHQTRDSGEP